MPVQPVTTVEELQTLDEKALVRGYLAGRKQDADYTETEKGYWHGYLNGMVDGGHAKPSKEQMELAKKYIDSGAFNADMMLLT